MRTRSRYPLFALALLILVGCSTTTHLYTYQAQPPALPPGTPPTPPSPPPQPTTVVVVAPPVPPVSYRTIYESAWDDPSLVVFRNDSYRKVRIELDGQMPIILGAYGITANLHLGIGEHKAKISIEKPTAAHGTWEVVRLVPIFIHPEGRSQIVGIYAQ